ncbi:MAG: HAMP domain-containing histidine kinase [Bacteroidetes bacterium]|nr:HAMP domain-containing histidine kinase [Bacteroidota bacterium]
MKAALIIFCLGFFASLQAQNLLDSAAINNLNLNAYNYFLYKPDSSIALANLAVIAAEKGKFKYLAARSYFVLSKANWTKANYLLSIHYGYKALKVYENTQYILAWGKCLITLARTFIDLKNLEQANVYIHKAHQLALQNQNEELLADVYREQSMLLQEKKLFDSALIVSKKGISLYQKKQDTLDISILYGRIARIYLLQKKYAESHFYNKKALLMDSLSNNWRALGISYGVEGELLYGLNKKDSTLYFLKKSTAVDKRIRNLTNMIRTHQLMSRVYEDQGDMLTSLNELRLVNQFKDSLYDREKNGQIQEMLAHYELSDKESAIKKLQLENVLEQQKVSNQKFMTIFFGIAFLLVATLSIQFWHARQQQVKSNQLKSKLFSVIGHDLRGPVNSLQSLLGLLTKEFISPEEFKEVLIKLKSNLNASQNTLENLLNWSLSQMRNLRTVKTVFKVENAIREVVLLLEETALRKKISIEFKNEKSIEVKADVNQVNLILRNIINNAIKFSQPNTSILIGLQTHNKYCTITISDTGIGMTSEEISMVLNSNEYFTKPGTENEKGTGLGFQLCKDFIKLNKGKLNIESEVGKGTRVSISLPIS